MLVLIKRFIYLFVFLSFISAFELISQVEHVPIANPIYDFLVRAENKGYMKNMSLSSLPLQKKEIINVLIELRKNIESLSNQDKETLYKFETEFEVYYYNQSTESYSDNKTIENNALYPGNKGADLLINRTVVFYSDKDTNQIFFDRLFSNDEKYFYHYQDSNHKVIVRPLGKIDFNYRKGDSSSNALMAHGGFRLNGTLSKKLGYMLQVTNGSLLGGDRLLALQDPILRQNIKFNNLSSDVDITESHLRYQDDWFYAYVGRESRLLGAGLDQRIFISNTSPASDGLSLGAKFKKFEYRFSHFSLLALKSDTLRVGTGFAFEIPSKYYSMHRFSFRPDWGELSFWEGVIYSERSPELAYLNPLSFLKSVEHALRDRDNSIMGLDATIRPLDNWQIKGSWLLDDIIISEIGKGYWSNKTAWNIATTYSFQAPIDLGFEYSRVEPYTYSHFNVQNSITNDGLMFGSNIKPNSDRFLLKTNFWIGERYPLFINLSYTRHGRNEVDENGNLIRNVGGDPLKVQNWVNGDSYRVSFLDGDLSKVLRIDLGGAWEPVRHYNLHLRFYYDNEMGTNKFSDYGIRFTFRFEDF